MKSKLIVLTLATILCLSYSSYVLADAKHNHKMSDGTMMEDNDMPKEQLDTTKADEVGNKICPVTGNPVDDGSMGEPVKYEYNGKIYNLCCKMCAKDFKKDPEKYSKIAEEEAAQSIKTEEGQENKSGHDHK